MDEGQCDSEAEAGLRAGVCVCFELNYSPGIDTLNGVLDDEGASRSWNSASLRFGGSQRRNARS